MRTSLAAVVVLGCAGEGKGGDGTDGAEEPLATWACVHVAEGTLLDGSATREDAPTMTLGRQPYRVNLLPAVPNFVRFEVDEAGEWTLLADEAGAVPAIWAGETRTEVPPGEPDPECDEDLPEVTTVTLEAGEHWLEIGPLYQGNVWLVFGR